METDIQIRAENTQCMYAVWERQ